MATYYAVANGLWKTSTTWSNTPGGAAGFVPGINDQGLIGYPYTVTVDTGMQCGGWWVDGGTMIINADITMTDMYPISGHHINFSQVATSKVYSTYATINTPYLIKSSSAIPTNPITMMIYNTTGPELRTFNLDYFTLKGFAPFIGNTNFHMHCNDQTNVNSVWITDVTPIERDTSMLEHVILGRTRSRIYRLGDHAGSCVVSGYCNWDSYFPTLIRNMKADGTRVGLIWDRVTMPFARIEGVPRFTPKRGSPRVDFSITLVEDF